jgi:HEAT repeat protein
MESVSRWVEWLGPARYVFDALFATGVTITLLVLFILVRRARRGRYLAERDRHTLAIRQLWPAILRGAVPPERWRFQTMDREIVEAMIADRLEVAGEKETEQLLACLRSTGLLDMRIYEARALRGWRRRQALVSLGRMRAPEAIPALADALDSSDAETRIAAVRGLGRTGLPEAAEPILERVVHESLRVPERPLQNALLHCCRTRPSVLLPYVRKAEDRIRPLLARVLGEVASPELDEDLLLLASDPLAEVRASAARALAEAKPRLALTALSSLAADREWFVRLRAVVALGALDDPRAIPVLVETLCDPNRYVRLRSAAALARLDAHHEEIFRMVTQTRDRYAMQALVSELERTGGLLVLMSGLADPRRRASAEAALLGALRAGTYRQLVDALSRHADWRVRVRMARLLARSGEVQLVAPLELRKTLTNSRREQRILRWVIEQLRRGPAGEPVREKVPV